MVDLRPAAVRPLRLDPAGRVAVVAVRRHVPDRDLRAVLDPGQGRVGAQPAAPPRPDGDGQPARPRHDLRRRGDHRVRAVHAALQRAARSSAAPRSSCPPSTSRCCSAASPTWSSRSPCWFRIPEISGRADRRPRAAAGPAGPDPRRRRVRRAHPAGPRPGHRHHRRLHRGRHRRSARPRSTRRASAAATPPTACCSRRCSSGWPSGWAPRRGWRGASRTTGCSARRSSPRGCALVLVALAPHLFVAIAAVMLVGGFAGHRVPHRPDDHRRRRSPTRSAAGSSRSSSRSCG